MHVSLINVDNDKFDCAVISLKSRHSSGAGGVWARSVDGQARKHLLAKNVVKAREEFACIGGGGARVAIDEYLVIAFAFK